MDKIVVIGGNEINGTIKASGAKNAALPIMAATLLGTGTSTISNIPKLRDVATMTKLLGLLGASVEFTDGTLTVTPGESVSTEAPYELVKTMRASVLVLGPLVARYGTARVSLPGGCAIGARPIDIHLKGLEAMGAQIELDHGYVIAKCKKLTGAKIVCDVPTVTGTENLMMAACLADGLTVIENAAKEPEIVELADVLRSMGAKIEGDGTSVIKITGEKELGGATHAVRADRIETGTFMVAAAVAGGEITITDARPQDLEAVIDKLRGSGVSVETGASTITVARVGPLKPVNITTQPHPGFPTDMQAQFMLLATQAEGRSVIRESIFENRFMHVPELFRMGGDIRVDGRVAMVSGKTKLSGTSVMATDLRASASLVIAGLVAEGTTEVLRVYHLDRGYEHIEKKLSAVGANIKRVSE